MENNELKEVVKQKYNELAQSNNNCSCSSKKTEYTIMSEDYSHLKGYEKDADLGVGCGIPTEFAKIKPGEVVIDLGSGAGNDCFVARQETGEEGKVIGIDFAHEMIKKARTNAQKLGFENIEFIESDIENIPLPENTADLVLSNCVLNLLPSKDKIFKEIFRVLKNGGRFCISDVVLEGFFPKEFTDNAALYAGCISSAIQKADYLKEIEDAGFKNIKIEKTKTISIPDEVLAKHLAPNTIENYKNGIVGIYSITVTGFKNTCCCKN